MHVQINLILLSLFRHFLYFHKTNQFIYVKQFSFLIAFLSMRSALGCTYCTCLQRCDMNIVDLTYKTVHTCTFMNFLVYLNEYARPKTFFSHFFPLYFCFPRFLFFSVFIFLILSFLYFYFLFSFSFSFSFLYFSKNYFEFNILMKAGFTFTNNNLFLSSCEDKSKI